MKVSPGIGCSVLEHMAHLLGASAGVSKWYAVLSETITLQQHCEAHMVEARCETTDIEVRTAMLGSHMAGSPCGDTAVLSDILKKASLRAGSVLVVVKKLVADSTTKLDAMIEDLRAVAGGAADGAVWSTSPTAKTQWSDIVKTANSRILSGKFASAEQVT